MRPLSLAILCMLLLKQTAFTQTIDDVKRMMDSLQKSTKGLEETLKKQAQQMQSVDLRNPGAKMPPAVKMSGSDIFDAEPLGPLPQKKTLVLTKAVPFTGVQLKQFYSNSYKSYYASVKDPKEKKRVDSFFKTSSNAVLSQLAAIAFFNTQYDRAILYSLRILEKDSSNVRAASNLAAICNGAGVPEKSVQVLEYYIKQHPQNSSLLNNCGQAYLLLGEIQKAESYLTRSLRGMPHHPEANASLAWIKAKSGNNQAAIDYAVKSLKSGYNETAIEVLMESTRDRDEFLDRLPEPDLELYPVNEDVILYPELPLPLSAFEMSNYHRNITESRKPYERQLELLYSSLGGLENMNIQQFMAQQRQRAQSGNTSMQDPRRDKGQLLIKKAERAYLKKLELYELILTDFFKAKNPALGASIAAARKSCEGSQNPQACFCGLKLQLQNAYLKELKPFYDDYRNKVWTATGEYARVLAYWEPILYRNTPPFTGNAAGFTRKSLLLTTAIKLAGLELMDLEACDTTSSLPAPEPTIDLRNNCKGAITIPFLIGEYSIDCEKIKTKVGEGIIVATEEDRRTGQFTLFLGVGAQVQDGLVSGGVSAGYFVTFNKDFKLKDIGSKFSAEASMGKIGPLSGAGMDAELSLGLESGVSTEAGIKTMNQGAHSWKNTYN